MEQARNLKTGIKYKDTPIGKIPVDWEVVHLSDVSEVNMGQSPSVKDCNEEGKGLPLYQGNAEFGSRYPSPHKWCNRPKKIANEGDLLMSVRPPVGEINIAPHKCCLGRGLAAIRAKVINDNFLYQSILLRRRDLQRIAQGNTFEAINREDLSEFLVLMPSLPEQKRIADILSSVDKAIEKTAQIIEKAKEVKKGLLQKLLTRELDHQKFKKTGIGEVPGEKQAVLWDNPVSTKPDHAFKGRLFIIDENIDKESSYREELKSLKKALMQVLLTGKIRV
jgi:type I restriction enzyme S subunit